MIFTHLPEISILGSHCISNIGHIGHRHIGNFQNHRWFQFNFINFLDLICSLPKFSEFLDLLVSLQVLRDGNFDFRRFLSSFSTSDDILGALYNAILSHAFKFLEYIEFTI